jgi:hypothetical protein
VRPLPWRILDHRKHMETLGRQEKLAYLAEKAAALRRRIAYAVRWVGADSRKSKRSITKRWPDIGPDPTRAGWSCFGRNGPRTGSATDSKILCWAGAASPPRGSRSMPYHRTTGAFSIGRTSRPWHVS